MSDRGSFVTEYIYCIKCFEAAKTILIGQEKYLTSIIIPPWSPDQKELPIIAGKIGGLYEGEELHTFEFEFIPKLESLICHKIRIAVLAETGEKIFTAFPHHSILQYKGDFEKEIESRKL